jgi:lipoprotein-anchoring transpeptidase ErfK/SrfK
MSRVRNLLLGLLLVLGALFCLADAALLAVRIGWPHARIVPGGSELARVEIAGVGEHVSAVRVLSAHGRSIPAHLGSGLIEPGTKVRGGQRLRIEVTVSRSRWLGWLLGRTETITAVVRTPAARLVTTLVYPIAGAPVAVRFSRPVKVISVRTAGGKREKLKLRVAHRLVQLGIAAAGENAAGTALVAGAPRSWERVPAAVRVNWFPAGPAPRVLVRPSPADTLVPSRPIVLTFSRPVTEVLGRSRPLMKPRVPGVWREPNEHTLVFQPGGLGFPLGRRVHLRLPRTLQVISGSDPTDEQTVTWQVPRGSLLRMKEMLADLGYLPLSWSSADGRVPLTASAQVQAAVDPPEGTFSWRFPKTPAALKGLWASSSERPILVRGAIMAFQSAHGMTPDGFPSMAVFRALLRDELAGRSARSGYSYVFVSETLPQTLTLWHDGRVLLRTAVNTGIASRPTALGTYPVYAHFASTTMSGINPDGTPYNDPGVPWVNYFNGGDAVHGFYRGSYGWPQSLGCVEVPVPTAAQIFPYVNVGTLVTVTA